MDTSPSLQPLDLGELKERLKALEFKPNLIAVTLIDGAIVLGGLMSISISDRDDVVLIRYNSPKGQRFGTSYIAEVPYDVIADIIPVPFTEDSLPKFQLDETVIDLYKSLGLESLLPSSVPVWDYPNPLAKIIHEHNSQVVTQHNLNSFGYNEKALSEQVIPASGIRFEKPFLLYTDFDFFAHTTTGGVEVTAGIPGIADITKVISPSLLDRAFQKLQNSFIAQASKSGYMNERWMTGCILTEAETQDTEIQGEKCIVIICASTNSTTAGETFPVLLKLRHLNYPLEFLKHIVSVLTFYGELVPIPIMVVGRVHQEALMARAIGFLHE